jgi:hypothetical protein
MLYCNRLPHEAVLGAHGGSRGRYQAVCAGGGGGRGRASPAVCVVRGCHAFTDNGFCCCAADVLLC